MPLVSVTWTSPTGSQCVATGSGGHTVVMDAPNGRTEWAGFKPSELLLAALLGCTGVDFTSILAKQRQQVTSISAKVHAERLDRRGVNRALDLAVERYCSVGATLAGAATITHRAVIEPERPAAAVA